MNRKLTSLAILLGLSHALLLAPLCAAGKEIVEPLADGRSTAGWTFYRDQARLDREYSHNELKASDGAYEWTFSPRSVNYADVFLAKPIAAPFDRIEVEVSNAGAPVELVARVGDEDWSEYISERVSLPAGDSWRKLSFPLESFKLGWWSKDANGTIDFPLVSVSLTVYEVKAGAEYRLLFRSLRLVREVGTKVRLLSGALPRVWRGGVAMPLRLLLASDDWARVTGRDVLLDLYQDGRLAYSRHLDELRDPVPSEVAIEQSGLVPLPHWPSGLYTAAIRVGGTIAAVQEVTLESPSSKAAKPSVCKVRRHRGAPTLFINGKPNSAMVYMTYRPLAKHFRQFGEAGVHVHSFSSTPTQAGYGLAPPCWIGPNEFDYSGIDLRASELLDADPAACFFPRIYLLSAAWWDQRHPDDLVTFDPGDGKPVPFFHQPGKRAPSWASEAWRRDTAEAIRRYIRHIQASSYADRVIGYHIASGTTEEWMQWGSNEDQWVDYSLVNLAKFRQWLRGKYRSEAALRSAWADPRVTFDTATIPTRAERAASEFGAFRDPAKAMRCIDYVLYNSWLVADTICYFARVVKEETHGRALVGVFYGYVLQLAGEQREQNAGHLALQQVWRCPDVDFVTSPSSYAFRQLGTGFSHFMSLLDSVKLHGKMWFDENDIRTWITREGEVGDAVGKTATYEETMLHQQREFANVLCNACGMWWFDMSGGWYDDPRLMAEIANMKGIADESLELDRSPVAEIAVVVDDKSSAYMKVSNEISHHLLVRQLPEMGRIGAPFAYVHLGELDRAPEYRMYVFLNCFAPSERERRLIEQKVKRGGHVVVWVWAPGLIRNDRIDVAAMEALTGIRLALGEQAAPLQVRVASGPKHWVRAAGGTTYGVERPFAPVVFAQDGQGTILGTLVEGGGASLVVKQFNGWTSVYSSAPVLPHDLLRALAQRAGAHLYAPAGDVVYANRSLLAVSVNEGGARTVHLPRRADVFDLYEGREIGRKVTRFTADIPPKATRLWRIRWTDQAP
jgi:hypothetical protein